MSGRPGRDGRDTSDDLCRRSVLCRLYIYIGRSVHSHALVDVADVFVFNSYNIQMLGQLKGGLETPFILAKKKIRSIITHVLWTIPTRIFQFILVPEGKVIPV